MLALLLQRTLEHRLRNAQIALSARACLEISSTCHLNRMKQRLGTQGLYSVTEATNAQSEILQALGLGHLTEDAGVARFFDPDGRCITDVNGRICIYSIKGKSLILFSMATDSGQDGRDRSHSVFSLFARFPVLARCQRAFP